MGFKGEDRILYIKDGGVYLPLACLTSNPLSESVEMLESNILALNGWKGFKPVNQNYSIDFDGLQIATGAGNDITKLSYDTLRVKKRSRTLIEWKIEDAAQNFIDEGSGYIQSIGESNQVGDFLSFNGSIIGFGLPVFSSEAGIYIFQDSETFIFQDGTGFLFN